MRLLRHPHGFKVSAALAGFSLIELMISLTIGLVISIAAMSAYLGSSYANRVSDAQSRMNEDAQAALNVIAQQIRMAGTNPARSNRDTAFKRNPVYSTYPLGGSTATYTTTPGTYTVSSFSVRGCDGTFSSITSTTNLDSFGNCGTSTLPDSIGVSYEGDEYNTVPSGSSAGDCLANAVPTITATFSLGTSTTATFWVVDNRFYVANTSAGVPNLYCKGNGNASGQPLVENVEDMQFLYGTVSAGTTATTATVAGYLTAAEVITETSLAALASDAARWAKVVTVRICVLVRSENPVLSDAASGQYYNCDGTLDTSKTDLRMRRAYTTTVSLRNRRS